MDLAATVWGPLGVMLVAWSLRELRQLRLDLTSHMGNEETQRAHDATDRAERQGSIDVRLTQIEDRLDAGAERFERVEDGLAGLQRTVIEAMRDLRAGHPEVRR